MKFSPRSYRARLGGRSSVALLRNLGAGAELDGPAFVALSLAAALAPRAAAAAVPVCWAVLRSAKQSLSRVSGMHCTLGSLATARARSESIGGMAGRDARTPPLIPNISGVGKVKGGESLFSAIKARQSSRQVARRGVRYEDESRNCAGGGGER